MKKQIFKTVAKLNKAILPSFTKQGVDPAKAPKWKLAIIGWRYFITKNSL